MHAVEATGTGRRVVGRVPRREMLAAAAVCLAISGAYLAIASWRGALGIPRNDDWAYLKIAFRFAEDGAFELNGWPAMTLIGQTVLAWPVIRAFGPEIALLQVMVAALAALGLWATYLVIRDFLARGWAALSVGCLALGPLYGSLSVSFMTDVPAFAFQAASLLAGLAALRSQTHPLRWFIVALGLAAIAFSIRESGAVAGVAVMATLLSRRFHGGTPSKYFIVVSTTWLACLVGLYLWRSGLPGSFQDTVGFVPKELGSLESAWMISVVLGTLIAPAVAVVSLHRLSVKAWGLTRPGTVVVVASALMLNATTPLAFVDSYFQPAGPLVGVTLAGQASSIFPSIVWDIFRLVGFVGVLMMALLGLVVALTRTDRAIQVPVGRTLSLWFCVGNVGALAAWAAGGASLFDRYLIPVIPFVAALLIAVATDYQLLHRWAIGAGGAVLAVLAVVGLVFVDTSATLDGSKWRLAETVEQSGVNPASINGGFEWFSYHQPVGMTGDGVDRGNGFWVGLFRERQICVSLVFDPDGPVLLRGAEVAARPVARLHVRSLAGVEYRLVAVTGPQRCSLPPSPPRP